MYKIASVLFHSLNTETELINYIVRLLNSIFPYLSTEIPLQISPTGCQEAGAHCNKKTLP